MSQNNCEVINQMEDFVETSNSFFMDLEEDGRKQKQARIPLSSIVQMGAVGSGIISLISNISPAVGRVYTIANGAPGFALKMAKDGTYWGALSNARNVSKMAKLKDATPTLATGSCVYAILIVAAVVAVEHQIGKIIKTQEQILSFLENQREANIEGDVKTLTEIIEKYKYSFDNERFISTHHVIVADIKRKAQAYMFSYKKDFDKFINSKEFLFTVSSKVQSQLDDVTRKLKYYRLAAYTYSLASFLDVLLSCSYQEEYIHKSIDFINEIISEYEKTYDNCLNKINEKAKKTLNSNVVKVVGSALKKIGEKSKNDKTVNYGEQSIEHSTEMQERYTKEFECMKESKIEIFVTKLTNIDIIYNQATRIDCDDKYLYLYA